MLPIQARTGEPSLDTNKKLSPTRAFGCRRARGSWPATARWRNILHVLLIENSVLRSALA